MKVACPVHVPIHCVPIYVPDATFLECVHKSFFEREAGSAPDLIEHFTFWVTM
jgi:hypothetical protein